AKEELGKVKFLMLRSCLKIPTAPPHDGAMKKFKPQMNENERRWKKGFYEIRRSLLSASILFICGY
ncbi:MAG: hypothetical protein QM680_14680, partial [Luteolibacter sp.]